LPQNSLLKWYICWSHGIMNGVQNFWILLASSSTKATRDFVFLHTLTGTDLIKPSQKFPYTFVLFIVSKDSRIFLFSDLLLYINRCRVPFDSCKKYWYKYCYIFQVLCIPTGLLNYFMEDGIQLAWEGKRRCFYTGPRSCVQ
jgi:hypothetical protein